MRPQDRWRVLADEMLTHARAIAQQVHKGRAAFFDPQDPVVRDAVEHRLELLAEALGKLPKAFADANPGVPWSSLRALRHEFAHPYEDAIPRPADHERVWRFVLEDLPPIARKLERPHFPKSADDP